MQANQAMTRRVYCCAPEDSLSRAAQIMWEKDTGCLPVVDAQGRLVGIITDRDICMAAYTRGKILKEDDVASTMARQVVSCRGGDDLRDVELLMKGAHIRRIPVVDDHEHLLGLVTLADLARREASYSTPGAKALPGVAVTLAAICEPRAAELAAE